MNGLPVGPVGGGAVVGAFAGQRTVLVTVLVVHGRHVVVAEAHSYLRCCLELCTELQG